MRTGIRWCAVLSALLIWTAGLNAPGCFAVSPARAESSPVSAEESGKAPEKSEVSPVPAETAGAEISASPDWFEEKGLDLGKSSVRYPSLREGILPEELRAEVNGRILEDGRIREYLNRMTELISGGALSVSWRGAAMGPVFSFAVSAEGAVTTPRKSFVWTAGNVDLRDGREIRPEEILADPEHAREVMESYLEETVAPELSAHLLNSQLTPLPDLFRITVRGLIWMYPEDQLSTLSDRAGDVLIPWNVIRDELNLAEGSLAETMGIPAWLGLEAKGGESPADPETAPSLSRENADRLRAMTAEGAIPGIPARLGDSMQALTEQWRMLTDPDVYLLGRMFALEGAEFRNVFLMTDYLSESWENSHVDGIRVDLGGVYGLTVGETPRSAWLETLGDPDHSVSMNEEQAEAWRAVPGIRDYYEFGGHRLQLHADEEGILAGIIISE